MSEHLNNRHKRSKQAQRDSVDFFSSLYFKNHNELEEGVIYEIRKTGVLVFLPKYGTRHTLHIKSARDSKIRIDLSQIQVNQKK